MRRGLSMPNDTTPAPTPDHPAKRPTLTLCPPRARDTSRNLQASDAEYQYPAAFVRRAAFSFRYWYYCNCIHCAADFFRGEVLLLCDVLCYLETLDGVPAFIREHETMPKRKRAHNTDTPHY